MHVCHFCDSTFETDFFRNIARGLGRKGVKVTLLELGSGTPPAWLEQVPGVEYRSLNAGSKTQYPSAVRSLAKFLESEKVDILHTHLYWAGLLGVLSKFIHKRTTIALMRHHTSVVRMLGTRVHLAADKWMAERADRVMTVSEAARRYMLETDCIRRDDVEVVYTGFDFEKLAPDEGKRAGARSEFGFTADDVVIGYVANVVPGKGHVQLLKAFGRIREEVPTAKLLFTGRGMTDEVREAAGQFPEGIVVFGGWRDDVSGPLNAMDVFVQPSLSEAFSQVLVEAMGVALPVVATRVGGAEEVITNEENGILIDPGKPSEIADAVLRVLGDDVLREKIKINARASAEARFGADAMVDRLFGLYERWMPERGRGAA